MKLLTTLILYLACLGAQAKCITNDAWHGPDKQLHFGAGLVVSMAVATHTGDAMEGFWTGVAVGAAKEALDATGSGTCSLQDLLVTVAGSAIGAYSAHWLIIPNRGGLTVSYRNDF